MKPIRGSELSSAAYCALCGVKLTDEEVKTNISCDSLNYMYCYKCMKSAGRIEPFTPDSIEFI